MIKDLKKKMTEYEMGVLGVLMSSFLLVFLRYIFAPFVRFVWIKNVEGLENLPKKGPFIVASNHESYFDFICFWAISPHQVQYLAAEKFYRSKFWKPIMVATGQIKVDRVNNDKTEVHKQAHYILENKGVLGIFPEGTRSRSGEMGKAFTGVTKFALTSKVPIVPVGVIGTYDILPPHKKIPKFRKCTIKIDKPLYHNDHYDKEHTKDLLRHLTDELMWQIGKMTGKEYSHHYDFENKKKLEAGILEGKIIK